jgi:hypothetical protein
MFAHRTATGLTIALLALPATATAMPLTDSAGGGASDPQSVQAASDYDNWGGDPHPRTAAPTSSLAGTTTPDLRSPDAADAARAGEIAIAMEHYRRSQPNPVAAKPASTPDDAPAWPEIAIAGIAVLATAGGVAHVRMRRTRRVTA